jgi:xylulokinase
VDLGRVRGVSGAGQQHGSVYLNRSLRVVGGWSSREPLRDQVRPLLSRPTAPIWMDSATSAECQQIAASLGGEQAVVAITGSRPTERFTGPQIRKFAQDSPEAWQRTQEIHLVSSFMASLLVGTTAAIDHGDGAGMNLLELATGSWSGRMLDATAPGLGEKLPRPVPSVTPVGTVARYFVEKYGFARGTPVIAFTGDNPSSLVGMGATRPGTAVISLGTSDTVFAAMARPHTDPRGYGHVFGNPAGGFMSLICFSNGSLAREEIARRFGLSWADFARAIVDETSPGNGGCLMLPYFVPEITPKLLRPELRLFGSEAFTAERDAPAAARAIVEAQALSMQLHSDWIGQSPDTILVTGGASRNAGILRVLADVFQAELLPLGVANASALGGALRAAHAVGGLGWDELSARFAAPDAKLRTVPNPETRAIYHDLGTEFRRRLGDLLAAGS